MTHENDIIPLKRFFLFIITYASKNYTKLKEIKIYKTIHTKTNPYCFSQQIGYKKHWFRKWKIFWIFCFRENVSKKFLSIRKWFIKSFLSLMKQIQDVIILKFKSLEKLLSPNNKTWTISFSLIFRIPELI